VSLEVPHGQTLAILGRNGAGKRTLLRIIAQVAEPDAGTVTVFGRVSPLLELGAGFSPELTGRRNMHVWMGECHVHAGIDPENIRLQRSLHPQAEFLIHPECGCSTSVLEAIRPFLSRMYSTLRTGPTGVLVTKS